MIWPTPLTDFDAFLDLLLRRFGHIAQVGRRRYRYAEHGRGIGVELLNRRLLGGLGKVRYHGLHLVFHFLGGDVNVFLEDKLHKNLRDTLDRRRAQLIDTADAVDRFLDLLGYLGLDLLRRCARD